MNRNHFEDFRARMKNVNLPTNSRNHIEQAILNERATAEQASEAQAASRRATAEQASGMQPSKLAQPSLPAQPTPRCARPTWRYAVAAVCFLALVLGGLVFTPTVERLLGAKENSFALSAYATGTAAEGSNNLKLALGSFAEWGGWYTFDESEWGDEGPYQDDFIHDTGMEKGYLCSANFDLTCKGTGIASLTYELDGNGVYFNFDPAREGSTPPKDFSRYRFTTGPDDLKNPDKGYLYLVANVPAEGELAEPTAIFDAYLKRRDAHIEELRTHPEMHPDDLFTQDELEAYRNAQRQIDTLVHTKAAEMIAESTLTITATFDDGTTESHAYRIAPVAGFAERYQMFADSNNHGDPPSLFLIEQLS